MPPRGARSLVVELESWLDRSMNWVGSVSSGVGSGPEAGQREGEREEERGSPSRGNEKYLPASPIGTNAKAKATAEADSAVIFMLLLILLLILLLNFEVS